MNGFLKGGDGKISSMRLFSGLVVFSVMAIFVAQNVIAMIKGCGFISMGATEAMLVAGVLGAKAGQTFAEVKASGNGKKPPATTDEIPVGKGQ